LCADCSKVALDLGMATMGTGQNFTPDVRLAYEYIAKQFLQVVEEFSDVEPLLVGRARYTYYEDVLSADSEHQLNMAVYKVWRIMRTMVGTKRAAGYTALAIEDFKTMTGVVEVSCPVEVVADAVTLMHTVHA
jgi:hypothetical protein